MNRTIYQPDPDAIAQTRNIILEWIEVLPLFYFVRIATSVTKKYREPIRRTFTAYSSIIEKYRMDEHTTIISPIMAPIWKYSPRMNNRKYSHSFSFVVTVLLHCLRFICDIQFTKYIEYRICFFRRLLSYNVFTILMLNVEFSIVKKPFAHGREWWGDVIVRLPASIALPRKKGVLSRYAILLTPSFQKALIGCWVESVFIQICRYVYPSTMRNLHSIVALSIDRT